MSIPDRIAVEFTRQEALVLWDFLFRCSDQAEGYSFVDPAEERMLWELEIRLQQQLNEVILDNEHYRRDVEIARDAVKKAFPD